MEKYAVETALPEKEEGTKEGGVPKCSICGKPAERQGNVWTCPEHGTKPFEKE